MQRPKKADPVQNQAKKVARKHPARTARESIYQMNLDNKICVLPRFAGAEERQEEGAT